MKPRGNPVQPGREGKREEKQNKPIELGKRRDEHQKK